MVGRKVMTMCLCGEIDDCTACKIRDEIPHQGPSSCDRLHLTPSSPKNMSTAMR